MSHRPRLLPIVLSATLALASSALLCHAQMAADTSNATAAPAAPATPAAPAEAAPAAPATPPPVAAPAPAAPTEMPADSGETYTVKKGDSLWVIARKHHTTVDAIKALNSLTTDALKLGQVLKLPAPKTKNKDKAATPAAAATPSAAVSPKKAAHEQTYSRAQPVQDFDVPPSTFASCPMPAGTDATDGNSTADFVPVDRSAKGAPIAKLVTPDELTADEQQVKAASATPKPAPKSSSSSSLASASSSFPSSSASSAAANKPAPAPSGLAHPDINDDSTDFAPAPSTSLTYHPSSSKQTGRALFSASPSSSNDSDDEAAADWGTKFLAQARQLGDQGISYNQSWRPPQESSRWVMDCSNTARYLYKVTAHISLPRTASDQYYYLHQQGKAWDVPEASNGYADCNYLRRNLKPGDLLFWENTYKPERQPPITHVMVFLGTNDKNQWIMAGSQSTRGGEHNRRRGGPDIYVFDPTQPSGGYTTWLGLVHHKGKFCAYGRPLEADPSKLAMAANN